MAWPAGPSVASPTDDALPVPFQSSPTEPQCGWRRLAVGLLSAACLAVGATQWGPASMLHATAVTQSAVTLPTRRPHGPSALNAVPLPSRRSVVGYGAGVAAALIAGHQVPPAIALASETLIAKSGAFRCQYTEPLVLAYDRTDRVKGSGVLALLVDFSTADTFAIRRYTYKDLGLTTDTIGNDAALGDAILTEIRILAKTVSIQQLATTRAADSGRYVTEYVVTTCLGRSEEGAEGAVRCLGPRDDDIAFVQRHYYDVAVTTPDYVYVGSASTVEDRWAAMAGTLRAVADSFEVRA